jgi:plastocyanin
MGSVRGRLTLLAGALLALGVAALLLGPALRGAAAQGGATVAIVDFAFDPVLTGIAVGDTITWTNYGAEHHTVTSDDSSFNSGNLAPGESFSQTFANTGSYTYRCRIHPSMTGTIIVNGAVGGTGAETEMQAVPVVGVGTAAPRPGEAMALLAGVAALALAAASLVLRRA